MQHSEIWRSFFFNIFTGFQTCLVYVQDGPEVLYKLVVDDHKRSWRRKLHNTTACRSFIVHFTGALSLTVYFNMCNKKAILILVQQGLCSGHQITCRTHHGGSLRIHCCNFFHMPLVEAKTVSVNASQAHPLVF